MEEARASRVANKSGAGGPAFYDRDPGLLRRLPLFILTHCPSRDCAP
jgi:hypothetical protein